MLYSDKFIPVAAKSHVASLLPDGQSQTSLNIIGYPESVFFGQILNAHVFPKLLRDNHLLTTICETALVPAVMQMAIAGVGVAWLPRSIVTKLDHNNVLVDLSNQLPVYEIDIIATRLKTRRSAFAELVWQKMSTM